jgi:hypothetical protein
MATPEIKFKVLGYRIKAVLFETGFQDPEAENLFTTNYFYGKEDGWGEESEDCFLFPSIEEAQAEIDRLLSLPKEVIDDTTTDDEGDEVECYSLGVNEELFKAYGGFDDEDRTESRRLRFYIEPHVKVEVEAIAHGVFSNKREFCDTAGNLVDKKLIYSGRWKK